MCIAFIWSTWKTADTHFCLVVHVRGFAALQSADGEGAVGGGGSGGGGGGSSAESSVSSGEVDDSFDGKDSDKESKKKKNRCAVCRKKVGLTGGCPPPLLI
jgi:hypothetical protein